MKLSAFILLASAAAAMAADQPSPAEAKMREALRNTMLQLRTAETERANLQAAQAEQEAKYQALTAQVGALTKQSADDKAKADKTNAEQLDKLAKQDGEIVQLKESLEKWKAAHAKVTEVANARESARAAFEAKSIVLERRVADQQRKNDAMYQLGTEVLKRYERFGLGDALTAREPFIGITRVKFENLIQDYSDKLTDLRIKPEPSAKAAPNSTKPEAKPKRAPASTAKRGSVS
jgi:hypothetical protein